MYRYDALDQRVVDERVVQFRDQMRRYLAGERASDCADGLKASDAGATYKGVGEASAIAATLLAAGKSPGLPVVVVGDASLPTQYIRYTTLAALPRVVAAGTTGPALILLGPQFAARTSVAAEADTGRCRIFSRAAIG